MSLLMTRVTRSARPLIRGVRSISVDTKKPASSNSTQKTDSIRELAVGLGIATGVLGTFGVCVNMLDRYQGVLD